MSTMYFDPALYPESTVTLTSLNGTFAPKRVAVPEGQGIFLGRLMDNNDPPSVPRFNSKVVSRQHAILSQPTAGRWQIKDAGSSSGTFLQNQRFGDQPYRLSEQGKESGLFEVHDGDIIQLGEDYVANGATHKCIKILINLPSPSPTGTSLSADNNSYEDGSFVDYAADPDVKREVENEFLTLWASLTTPLVFGKLNRAPPLGLATAGQAAYSTGTLSNSSPSTSWQQQPQVRKYSAEAPPSPTTGHPSSPAAALTAPSPADASLRKDCVAFVRQLQWDSNELRDRLVVMVEAGDAKILGFYRSLKQFPSAFKDVVTKHANGK
eukprot:Unigene3665_Nuclearia_a/m.11167 Unigene3665_Nuclearia_a/g.11167  ORF Unigene3665_Nuclearia_a/g.11167 Unigene3665_Nuclearia_a/m.11167 type:complete len:323 (+) Unigene3665_Nuclearia_a:255-1223(+)